MQGINRFYVKQYGAQLLIGVLAASGQNFTLTKIPLMSDDYEQICRLGRFLEGYYYPKLKKRIPNLRKMREEGKND